MYRKLTAIMHAIALSQPSMPHEQLRQYAETVRDVAVKVRVDPFTIVSIVHHESHWNPRTVADDREDYGLGQVRARFIGACRYDKDPLNAPSPACQGVKASLLSGTYNLQVVGQIIQRNKQFCRRMTGHALAVDWLSGYAGINHPKQGIYCGRQRVHGRWVHVRVNEHVRHILHYSSLLARKIR